MATAKRCKCFASTMPFPFIATHPGAELVERHGAEHRDALAQHSERHPHGTLAALAPDPRLTFDFKLGDIAVVCHAALKRG